MWYNRLVSDFNEANDETFHSHWTTIGQLLHGHIYVHIVYVIFFVACGFIALTLWTEEKLLTFQISRTKVKMNFAVVNNRCGNQQKGEIKSERVKRQKSIQTLVCSAAYLIAKAFVVMLQFIIHDACVRLCICPWYQRTTNYIFSPAFIYFISLSAIFLLRASMDCNRLLCCDSLH